MCPRASLDFFEKREILSHVGSRAPVRPADALVQKSKYFPKIWELPQNFSLLHCDLKQFPYCGPTNIRRHRTKFSHQGDLAPLSFALLAYLLHGLRYLKYTYIYKGCSESIQPF